MTTQVSGTTIYKFELPLCAEDVNNIWGIYQSTIDGEGVLSGSPQLSISNACRCMNWQVREFPSFQKNPEWYFQTAVQVREVVKAQLMIRVSQTGQLQISSGCFDERLDGAEQGAVRVLNCLLDHYLCANDRDQISKIAHQLSHFLRGSTLLVRMGLEFAERREYAKAIQNFRSINREHCSTILKLVGNTHTLELMRKTVVYQDAEKMRALDRLLDEIKRVQRTEPSKAKTLAFRATNLVRGITLLERKKEAIKRLLAPSTGCVGVMVPKIPTTC